MCLQERGQGGREAEAWAWLVRRLHQQSGGWRGVLLAAAALEADASLTPLEVRSLPACSPLAHSVTHSFVNCTKAD